MGSIKIARWEYSETLGRLGMTVRMRELGRIRFRSWGEKDKIKVCYREER